MDRGRLSPADLHTEWDSLHGLHSSPKKDSRNFYGSNQSLQMSSASPRLSPISNDSTSPYLLRKVRLLEMPSVSRGLYKWLLQGGASLEDTADRLNHVWTVALLLLLGTIISWKHGYTDPMRCWSPAEFPDHLVIYTNQMCWQHNLIVQSDDRYDWNIPAPRHSRLPFFGMPFVTERNGMVDIERREPSGLIKPEHIQTTMYQWVPTILCLQALLFKLPNILMYIFHRYSGLSFEKIRSLTAGFEALNMEDRLVMARQVAMYIQTWLNGRLLSLPWRALTVVWFCVKVFYVVNVVIQLVILDKFLSTKKYDNATSYGELIYNNLHAENVTYFRETPVFPRKVMCDFRIRVMDNVQQYTVMCTLPGNIFTEHAYMFLWVWLVFVAVVTSVSMAIWLLRRFIPIFRRRYIQECMDMASCTDSANLPHHDIAHFSDSYLGEDGMFVLKLIGCNSSHLLASHVVHELWALSRDSRKPTSGIVVSHAPQAAPSCSTGQL